MRYTLLFASLILTSIIFSQAPAGINYQAVIRNSSGALVASTTVAIRVQIRQTTATGTVVYQERHSVLTSTQGLVNMVIGSGTPQVGTFNNINWGTGPYFVNLGVDFANGTTYQDFGTQQLMSVPYALYAKTSGNQLNQWRYGNTVPASTLGNLGDFYLDVITGNVYYKNATTTWILTGNIKGPVGPTGATGPQGPSGATGPQGQQGIQGVAGPTGATGAQGPVGATGAQGVAGTNGSNGQNTLVKTTIEPLGSNCATGGVKIEFGLDANINGVLDAGEINTTLTKYVCNGATGATGSQGPAGATGAQGPQGIQGVAGPTGATGPQGPAGATGPQGVAGTNGSNGQNTLVKTTTEAAGANCTTGGVKIEYGLDANSNGILDAGEINATLTKYVCNGAVGAIGAQGPQGIQGPAGPQGLQGVPGPTGATGAQGPVGATGPQGPAGALPSGTANQTLRHDGTSWVANNLITNTGTNVGIGTNSPNSSAILSLNSTTHGLLIPSMNQNQRNSISSPATGLLIFQTDNSPGFYYFNGTSWTSISGSPGSGSTSGSNPNTLIYTTDGF